jgi:hypothetical protein
MPHLEPTYLRYIYDGLVKGSIHPENAAELPDGLIGLYEEAFDDRTSVIERQKLLKRFAIWSLFKKEVSAQFVAEILNQPEEEIQEFIAAYSAWFNSPESGKYQLYHERLKVYLLQKLSEGEVHALHEKLISRLEQAIEEQKADEFEWYGLEFLTQHYAVNAMLNGDGSKLLDLAYKQKHWQRQIKISKGYIWTKSGLHFVMNWASKYNDDEVIECGLQLVDLHHQEQNAAPQIVALVAEGDFDSALKRIEQFGGNDKEGLQRKFILYMLCLMELTLLESKNKPFRIEGIEKLLKHLDEQLPVDHSVLNWSEFFPSNLIFTMLIELEKNNFIYNQILNKTSVFEYEWMEFKKLFCNDEIRVLKMLRDYYQNRGIENIVLFNEKLNGNEPILFSSINIKMDKYWFTNLLVFNAKFLFENNYPEEALIELKESSRITQSFLNKSNIFLSLKNIFNAALDCSFVEILDSILVDFLDCAKTIEDELEREHRLVELIELSLKAQEFLLASKVLMWIETPYYRCCGLIAITNFMLKNPTEDLIGLYIKEVIILIDQINNEFEKGDVQKQYCKLLLNYKGLPDAVIFAEEIKGGGGFFRDDALGDIAIELINKSMITSSLELVQTKSLIFFIEAKVYTELCKYYIKHDQIDEAIRNLYLVTDDEEFDDRNCLLRYLISAIHDNKNENKIYDILVDYISQGPEELNKIHNDQTRSDLLFELYKEKSQSMLSDIDYLLSDYDKADLFGKISIFHKKNQENNKFRRYLNKAISAYDLFESELIRDYMYEKLIEHLIEEKELDLAEKLIEKLTYKHTYVSGKYRLLSKLKSSYQIQNKKVEQRRIIKKQTSILKNIHLLEDTLEIQLQYSSVNEKNHKEIEALCNMALTNAIKTNDIEKRILLISKVSTLLFKISRFEESNSILKDLIEQTIQLKDDIKKNSALKYICLELLNQLKMDRAISVAMLITSVSDRNFILKEIGVCSVIEGTIDKALIIENLITDQQIRQQLWSTIEDERIVELRNNELFSIFDKLHDLESKYPYFKGWVKNQKVKKMDIQITRNSILRVKSDLSQMEPIINKFLLNQLFFNQIKYKHFQRILNTPSLHWAIDINNHLLN